MKDLTPRSLVVVPVGVGSGSPAPGTNERPLIWGTEQQNVLKWDGTSYQPLDGAPKFYVQYTLAGQSLTHVLGAGPTLDIRGLFYQVAAPGTGDLVFIIDPDTPSNNGIWELGSTASPGAVPLTRPVQYPATQILIGGTEIHSGATIETEDRSFTSNFAVVNVNTTNNTIETPFEVKVGGVVRITGLQSGGALPSPLVINTWYVVQAVTPGVALFNVVLADVATPTTPIDLTTAGTNGGTSYIATLEFYRRVSSLKNFVQTDPASAGAGWSSITYSGYPTVISFLPGYAAGRGAESRGNSNTALGNSAKALGFGSLAVGSNAKAGTDATAGVAIGPSSFVSGGPFEVSATAVGTGAAVTLGGVALGANSYSTDNGIALGNDVIASSGEFAVAGSATAIAIAGSAGSTSGWRSSKLGAYTTDATPTKMFLGLDSGNLRAVPFVRYAVFEGTARTWNHTGTLEVSWWFRGKYGPTGDLQYEVVKTGGTTNSSATNFYLQTTTPGQMELMCVGIATTQFWHAEVRQFWSDMEDHSGETPPNTIALVHRSPTVWAQASETLTSGQLVNLWNSSGNLRVRKADQALGYKADGFVLNSCASGAQIVVYYLGHNPYLSGLTVGTLYLSTSGGVTGTAPTSGLVQQIGTALDATTMVFGNDKSVASSGSASTANAETFNIVWPITGVHSEVLFNSGATTLDMSTPITGSSSVAPTLGDTVLLEYATDTSKNGVYVLGSVSTLNAVPITRHPDWPSTRTLGAEITFVTKNAADPRVAYPSGLVFASDVDDALDLVGIDDPLLENTAIIFTTLQAGAVMPGGLAINTWYYVHTVVGNSVKLKATVGGGIINITSAGTNGGSGWICSRNVYSPINDGLFKSDFFVYDKFKYGPVALTSIGSALGSRWYGPAIENVAVGPNSAALDAGAVSLGSGSRALNSNSIAIGYNSTTTGSNSLSILGSAIGGGSIGILGSASYDQTIALGVASRVTRFGEVSIGFGSPAYPGSGITVADARDTRSRLVAQPTTTAPFVLDSSTDSNFTGIGLAYAGLYRFIKGRVTAYLIGTGYAVWELEAIVTVNSSNVPSVNSRRRLIAGSGNIASWKFECSATTTSFDGTRFDITVTGAANTIWVADLWSSDHDTYNFAIEDFGSIPLINTENVTEVVTSEALTAGQLVNFWSSSGAKVRKADSVSGYVADGYVMQNYSTSDVAVVYTSGENPFLSGLTVGPLYLGTAGAVSSSPGSGTIQRVGFAVSATKMVFAREAPAATVSGGAANMYSTTVDFGTEGVREKTFNVTVTGASTSNKVVASASLDMPAGVSEDELEMDMLAVAARVTAINTVRLTVASMRGPIIGQRNINLVLG